jgi:hypothetical protein
MSKRSMPSPAMVVACVALFVAMGGTGYAATQLSPEGGDAVASKKGKAKGKGKGKGLRGPRGLQGPAGPPGPVGPAGAAGSNAFGQLDYNVSAPVTNEAGEQDFVSVSCDPGWHVVGGGIYSSSSSLAANVNSSFPSNEEGEFGNTGWSGYVNNDGASAQDINAVAICAKAGSVTGP